MDPITSIILTVIVMVVLHRMYMYTWVEPKHKKETEEIVAKRVGQSRAVIWGQSCESLVPWLPDFTYSPPDVKHFGAPIDLIIFDGMSQGNIRKIIFMEIKTGVSHITPRERQIQEAIQEGRVEFKLLRIKENPNVGVN